MRWQRTSAIAPSGPQNSYLEETWVSPNGETYQVRVSTHKPLRVEEESIREKYKRTMERPRDSGRPTATMRYQVECPVCCSRDTEPLGGQEAYTICRDCSHCYQQEFYDPSGVYKNGAYGDLYTPENEDENTYRIEQICRPKAWYMTLEYAKERSAFPGNLLDIGCGGGHFISTTESIGIVSAGVEINKKQAEFATQKFRAAVTHLPLEEYCKFSRSFDLVTMLGVLEHTQKPVETIAYAKRQLSQNGMLFVEVPRFESLSTVLSLSTPGMGFRHMKTEDHIHIFSDNSLLRALEYAGMRPACALYFGLDSVMYSIATSASDYDEVFRRIQPTIDAMRFCDTIMVGAVPI